VPQLTLLLLLLHKNRTVDFDETLTTILKENNQINPKIERGINLVAAEGGDAVIIDQTLYATTLPDRSSQIDFIKIDVEGMEMKVLKGAAKSILNFRPFMLIEYLKSDRDEIIDWLKTANYKVYSGIGANYLCVPEESSIIFNDLLLVS
jgi:hypothetical protein